MPTDKTKFSLESAEEETKWLLNLLQQARSRRFFGTLNITMKEGKITEVEQSQTFKPPKTG